MQNITKITTRQCSSIVEITNTKGKIPFIVDRSDALETFFTYTADVCYVNKLVVQDLLGSPTHKSEEIGEHMRQAYITGAKYGKTVIYFLGQVMPDRFNEFCSTKYCEFNAEIIFDTNKFRKRDEFVKIVKMHEDFDRYNEKDIFPSEELEVGVLIQAHESSSTQEIIADARKLIPKFDKNFEIFENFAAEISKTTCPKNKDNFGGYSYTN